MARPGDGRPARRLSRGADRPAVVAGRSKGGRRASHLLPAREGIERNRARIVVPSRMAAHAPDRNSANVVTTILRGLMTKLPAEAYAIIEGKHSDPFRYLGLHSEGGHSVVRAFIPEASNVEAVGEHGETAQLERLHDAGLFAGALPNGSKRYQLRARFGDNVVNLDDP